MIDVLIVDDEPLVLLTIRSLCDWKVRGIRIVHECQNGKDALEFVREHAGIDVIVTDVDMPVMSGLELAEAARAEGVTAGIAFLSAYSNFDYARRAFKSGASDYILKTELDADRLVALIEKCAATRSIESAPATTDSATEGAREEFFRASFDRPDGDHSGIFPAAAFSAGFPLSFMILRPGDMPLVRQRYGANLLDFRRTSEDLLRHYVPSSVGDCGAISFDLYYVFASDGDALDKVYDLFYEASWAYLDIGFERRRGPAVSCVAELSRAMADCVAGFVPPSRIVVRTRRYIREHYGKRDLDLQEIAEYSQVSKNHLSWEFARESGENVSDFIARTRIAEAKKLLLETNLKTYEIAERVGYSNAETFCRAFRKATGTSPRRFS